MHAIRIGTKAYATYLCNRFYSKIPDFQIDIPGICVSQERDGNIIFMSLEVPRQFSSPSEKMEHVIRPTANVLTDLVTEDVYPLMLKKMASSNYPGLNEEEIQRLGEQVIKAFWIGAASSRYLTTEVLVGDIMEAGRKSVKNAVFERTFDYLKDNAEFIVDGFVMFRLKDHVKIMSEALNQVVEDYLVERDYREFLSLLKYFVEIQEPKTSVIHVMDSGEARLKLMDSRGNELHNEYLDGMAVKGGGDGTLKEDLLLSTLITLAPSKIILHLARDRDIAANIMTIFEGRVEFCPGCPWCTQ